jgi:hypothetical protein
MQHAPLPQKKIRKSLQENGNSVLQEHRRHVSTQASRPNSRQKLIRIQIELLYFEVKDQSFFLSFDDLEESSK